MDEHITPLAPEGEFVLFRTKDGQFQVECRFESETLWLSQAAMSVLYQVTPQAITQHIKAIYAEGELIQSSTCKDYLQVQTEGKREINRQIRHYNLSVILAVGYRVRSARGAHPGYTCQRTPYLSSYQRYFCDGGGLSAHR